MFFRLLKSSLTLCKLIVIKVKLQRNLQVEIEMTVTKKADFMVDVLSLSILHRPE